MKDKLMIRTIQKYIGNISEMDITLQRVMKRTRVKKFEYVYYSGGKPTEEISY
jgi:hypothetical protein